MKPEPAYIGALGFDFELFSINQNSLKFFLDGFDDQRFLEIARAVEAFGGKLSDPHSTGTIIFSNPRRTSCLSSSCYNVEFLLDSIRCQKLQSFGKYRIFTSGSDHSSNISTLGRGSCETINRSVDNIQTKKSESRDQHKPNNNDNYNSSEDEDSLDEAAFDKIEETLTASSGGSESSSNHDNLNVEEREHVEVNDAEVDNENECDETTSCTAARVRTYKRKRIGDADEQASIQQHRSGIRDDNMSQEGKSSKSTDSSHDSATSSCDSESDSDTSGDEYKPYKKPRLQRTRQQFCYTNRWRYSEEDNRCMIQYIIDNNAYHRARGVSIWEKFLADESVNRRIPVSVKGLASHATTLMKNYKEYTDDPEIRRKFERKLGKIPGRRTLHRRRESRAPPRWTEEEHQAMIDFLIENNLIYEALSGRVWQQCVKSVPLFQKSRRTAYGLHFRFRYHLRNDYAKYTNNAEALEKFREMELERPVKEKTNNE